MPYYLIRRLGQLALMLWLVSLLTFGMFYALPSGDPIARFQVRTATAETRAQAEHALGLDKPWYAQYARFAQGLVPWPGMYLKEDVYYSYKNRIPVLEEIKRRFPVSAVMVIGAAVLWMGVSILVGLLTAVRPGGVFDRATQGLGLLFISIPSFVIGFVLLYVFWFKAGMLPGTGLPPGESIWESILAGRFVLPSTALALTFIALYSRTTRRHVLGMLRSDAARTARAKGLPERVVVGKHALRGALVPLVTMFGLDFGALLSGTITLEVVFNMPGLGQYALQAVKSTDVPAVMGVTVFAATIVLFANLIVDVLYAYLDPRIRRA
ncbi:MAG: ABC transporter permease [Conexibacter sp.]